MVLNPKDVDDKARPDKATIESLEKKIDGLLIENRRAGRRTIEVSVSLFPDKASVDAIRQLYGQNGWSVTYHSDQRDGDYYVFSEKKTEQNTSSTNYQIDGGSRPYE